MDQQPVQPSVTPPLQSPDAQPQPAAPPQPSTLPPFQPDQTTPPPRKRSLRWLWISLPVALVLFLIALIAIPTFASLQAKAVATDFMQAVKDSDEATITRLSGEGSSTYLKNASTNLKNASFKIRETINKDAGYVVNFDVTGSQAIHDTSVIVKKGKVINFSMNVTGGSKVSITQQASTNACLTLSDLTAADVTYIGEEALTPNAQIFFQSLFFKPDSAAFLSDSIAKTTLDKNAAFYSKTNSKDYTFVIQGKVHEAATTSSGVALANERANKIKSELVSRGVDASRVSVLEAQNGVNSIDETRLSRQVNYYLPQDASYLPGKLRVIWQRTLRI